MKLSIGIMEVTQPELREARAMDAMDLQTHTRL
jgi:hypothetical protein